MIIVINCYYVQPSRKAYTDFIMEPIRKIYRQIGRNIVCLRYLPRVIPMKNDHNNIDKIVKTILNQSFFDNRIILLLIVLLLF